MIKARVADQLIDRSVKLAASGDAAMNRVQSVLPPAYRLRGRLPVLQEMQRTLWLEDSMNLQKCRFHVRNSA